MKPSLIIGLIFLFCTSQAQVLQLDSLLSLTHTYDSTLLKPEQKIDSIQAAFYNQADSLKSNYKAKLSVLSAANSSLNTKVDSLQSLQLPTGKYTQKIDSINRARQQAVASLDSKISSLKAKTTGKLKSLDIPPELNDKLSSATKDVDGFQLPVKDLNISSVDRLDNPLNSLDGLNTSIKSPLGEVGNIDGLQNVHGNLGDISKVTSEVGGYQKDIENLTAGNLNDVQQLPKSLENKAGELSGITDLQSQAEGATAPLKEISGKIENPDAMKQEVILKAQEVAIDHFAGKEEVLQQAMEKIAKYKQKYASINSLSEITKKRPNEMHGKPFIERIVPGIAFQIQKQDSDLLIDFNPYIGYRFTGRITAGAGWNQRILFDNHNSTSRSRASVFGPRAFGEYKLAKGISPRLEIETISTIIPRVSSGHTNDPSSRQWVWSYMAGIKKEYRVYKNIRGTAMVMFNLYDPFHKSPYGDRVITRFGFEFPLKKRAK